MSRHRRKQIVGFVASACVVAVVAIIGVTGWRMITPQKNSVSQPNAATMQPASAQVIVTQDDLDAAEKALDELDFSDNDAAEAEVQADL